MIHIKFNSADFARHPESGFFLVGGKDSLLLLNVTQTTVEVVGASWYHARGGRWLTTVLGAAWPVFQSPTLPDHPFMVPETAAHMLVMRERQTQINHYSTKQASDFLFAAAAKVYKEGKVNVPVEAVGTSEDSTDAMWDI